MQIPEQLNQIAQLIEDNWPKVHYSARPYLDAMYALKSMADKFGSDSAQSVVTYFLSNAKTWRGEPAKAIKEKLNHLLQTSRK